MAKNIVELNAKCPQCTSKETMIPRVDIKAASNVTVLQCIDCDWEFAKDQSVKIHGNFIVPELSFFPVDVNFTYKY